MRQLPRLTIMSVSRFFGSLHRSRPKISPHVRTCRATGITIKQLTATRSTIDGRPKQQAIRKQISQKTDYLRGDRVGNLLRRQRSVIRIEVTVGNVAKVNRDLIAIVDNPYVS